MNCHTPPKLAAGHGMPHLLEFLFESIIVDVLLTPLRYQRFSKSVSKLHAAVVTAAAMNRQALHGALQLQLSGAP
jgi:hypothetical protein